MRGLRGLSSSAEFQPTATFFGIRTDTEPFSCVLRKDTFNLFIAPVDNKGWFFGLRITQNLIIEFNLSFPILFIREKTVVALLGMRFDLEF